MFLKVNRMFIVAAAAVWFAMASFFLVPDISRGAPVAGDDHTPDVFIKPSAGAGVQHAILVEKSTQSLFLYSFDKNGASRLTFPCSTGEAKGDKKISGDKKTPEGVYFFTHKHDKKDLSAVYGSHAFPMDYPNFLDVHSGKTGSAIWLHGTNRPIKPMDSNGCVALANRDIEEVAEYISLKKTPIVVVETISYAPRSVMDTARDSIENFIEKWKKSVATGTYHDYLDFYDAKHAPDISWWNGWNRIRNSGGDPSSFSDIIIKNSLILKHKEVYTAAFDLFLNVDDTDIPVGKKKFFISKESGALKIFGDVYMKTDDAPGSAAKSESVKINPIIAAGERVRRIHGLESEKEQIARTLDQWIVAWSSKNIKAYANFYARDFSYKGMSKREWVARKKSLNSRYSYIRVFKKDVDIKLQGKTGRVSFVQTYESPVLKAVGKKKLVLKREGAQWRIYRETWEAL